MKKLGALEWTLIAAVVVFGVLLYVNRGCTTCKHRLNSIQGGGQGVFPGAGSGVMVRDTDSQSET